LRLLSCGTDWWNRMEATGVRVAVFQE
jgi:hypothetical protein